MLSLLTSLPRRPRHFAPPPSPLAPRLTSARAWIELSSSGPKEVYRQIQKQYGQAYGVKDEKETDWMDYKNAKIVLSPHHGRDGGGLPLAKKLKEVVPTAALVGGMCIALLSITADLFGAIGSGTGILMAVTIIFDIFERLQKESGEGGVQGLWRTLTEGLV